MRPAGSATFRLSRTPFREHNLLGSAFQLDNIMFVMEKFLIQSLCLSSHIYMQVVGAIVFQPINRGLPLRCLEEKYGLATNPQEARLTLPEKRSQKRLSLNITNGQAQDHVHGVHDNSHKQCNGMGRGNQLRSVYTPTHIHTDNTHTQTHTVLLLLAATQHSNKSSAHTSRKADINKHTQMHTHSKTHTAGQDILPLLLF